MPEWLDLLVRLRTETGKMATLHGHYRGLLSHPSPEGLEMAGFVWDKFRGDSCSGREMQRALFWLQVRGRRRRGEREEGEKAEVFHTQDLTRLKIELPFIHHMFESALEQRNRRTSSTGGSGAGNDTRTKVSVASSFDEEVEEQRQSAERRRKGSSAR